MGYFSYDNRDPKNIRNIPEYGGGGLMDIGCYLIYTSRLAFGEEPGRVCGLVQHDPDTRTDVMTFAMLDFPSGPSSSPVARRLSLTSEHRSWGTERRIEIEVPFNAPPDQPCRIFIDDGVDPSGRAAEILEFEVCDQYTIRPMYFPQAFDRVRRVPVPLEGSIRNMAVIEAIFRSAKSGKWEEPQHS
jgi:predicted dehydrogenase